MNVNYIFIFIFSYFSYHFNVLYLLYIDKTIMPPDPTVTLDGIIYTYSGSTATVTGFDAQIQSVSVISSTILNGAYSVVGIGELAFANCTILTQMTISDSVISMGNGAFYECSNLSQITISNNVTSIGNSTFFRCTNLSQITIPLNVTSIGNSAFEECTNLDQVTIPLYVTSIGYSAFEDCTSLTQVTFANPTIYTNCGTNCFFNIGSNATGIFENVSNELLTGASASLPDYFATTSFITNCILKGTPILTSNGYVNIEELCINDTIMTWDQRVVKIIGLYIQHVMADTCELIPYKIPKGTLGALDDLYISKHHCVLIDGEYFNVPHNMPQLTQSELHVGQSITYYHIETDNYFTDTLVANGVPIETFTRLHFDQIKQQAEFIVVGGQSFRKLSELV